jgi:predicted nucleotidyltransferase
MTLTKKEKEALKRQVATCLATEPEVRKVVIFGSFLESDSPNDLDIAVFQESDESYLPLALKYRRKLMAVAEKIPLDVIPVRPHPVAGSFLREIERGEVVYER